MNNPASFSTLPPVNSRLGYFLFYGSIAKDRGVLQLLEPRAHVHAEHFEKIWRCRDEARDSLLVGIKKLLFHRP
ncbi:MAG TPA: hypothetical protein VGJ68_00305 [Bradyrhizobium sp.]